MSIKLILICVLVYMTFGCFIDDTLYKYAQKTNKPYNVPAWFIILCWPAPLSIGIAKTLREIRRERDESDC